MKKLLFMMIILFPFCLLCNGRKQIKMYVFYTPSHKEMYEKWFLPSIHPDDNYEIIAEYYEQECESAIFMKLGWTETMKHKVEVIIRGIKENWGNIFVHADVDIQFFGPTQEIIESLMEGKDFIVQKNSPRGVLCAGFFACRANEKTLSLWLDIKNNLSSRKNDQVLLNQYLRGKNRYSIVWDYLPTDKFVGGGTFTGKIWKPGYNLFIPSTVLMFHANYTVGVENKIKLLQYVREKVGL